MRRWPPEIEDGDAIIRLVQEGEGGVIDQHCPSQVTPKQSQVLQFSISWYMTNRFMDPEVSKQAGAYVAVLGRQA